MRISGDVVCEMVFFVRNKSDRRELLASMASVDHVSSLKIHDNGIIFEQKKFTILYPSSHKCVQNLRIFIAATCKLYLKN